MSSHQKLIVPHFAVQFPIQMKRALGKDVILRRPRWGLSSTIARFPGAEAPGWPYVAHVGGLNSLIAFMGNEQGSALGNVGRWMMEQGGRTTVDSVALSGL
jgi:hypothetical protein